MNVRVSIHAPAWGATESNPGDLPYRTVSIHAPAWGATPLGYFCLQGQCVSIHAPAWGATQGSVYDLYLTMFQSTHPHGVRRQTSHQCVRVRGFNPRTCMGCDIFVDSRFSIQYLFQSTHPHGVRHKRRKKRFNQRCFNPRTRMGCDEDGRRYNNLTSVSIHAPAWGATSFTVIIAF